MNQIVRRVLFVPFCIGLLYPSFSYACGRRFKARDLKNKPRIAMAAVSSDRELFVYEGLVYRLNEKTTAALGIPAWHFNLMFPKKKGENVSIITAEDLLHHERSSPNLRCFLHDISKVESVLVDGE